MLTSDRIKPYLQHEDRYLRRAALDFFWLSWSRDPEILPAILDAADRFQDDESRESLQRLHRFVLTEASLDRVLERLTNRQNEAERKELLQTILAAPIELLAARESQLASHPQINEFSLKRVRERLEWRTWPAEKLWDELQESARRAHEKQGSGPVPTDDLYRGHDLVRDLAQRDFPDAETIGNALQRRQASNLWLQELIVTLAGERRIREAVPFLIDLFRTENEYAFDEVSIALTKIGAAETARLIQAAWPKESEAFRFWTAEVFATIPHVESEEAILALLKTQQEESTRTQLCHALCSLFSERGVPIVEREIAQGYDVMMANLQDDLLAVADMLGIALPHAKEWKRERDETAKELAAHKAEYEAYRQGHKPAASPPPKPSSNPLGGISGKANATLKNPIPSATPIRLKPQKVGRNNPCPCGSGKKYKKCCGVDA